MENQDGSDSSKKRIRIACDTCRRKKIKCNGQSPCSNCVQVGEPHCHYAERPPKKKVQKPPSLKPKKSKKLSHAKTLQVIDSRLSSLESVLSRLSYKLDSLDSTPGAKPPQFKHQQSMFYKDDDSATDTDENDDQDEDEDDNENENEHENENENEATDDNDNDNDNNTSTSNSINQPNGTHPEPNTEAKTPKVLVDNNARKDSSRAMLNSKNMEQYFGNHSIMSIFSHKSLDWIEQTLGPDGPELTSPIRNLPFMFLNLFKTFMMKWVDPPLVDHTARKRLLESPFPIDPNFVYDFIDKYYTNIPMVALVQDGKEMRGLFEDYYKNFDPRTPTKIKRKFKYSEYLMMAMTLLMVIGSKISQDQTRQTGTRCKGYREDKGNGLSTYSNDELIALQSTLFDNVVYYYHRISVISDGIETIQAILMLIIYIESNVFVSHINYNIIGVAVRFAQEMGLHRSETYDILEFEQQSKRRKIWWLCHYYDMEICFRNGKPPAINIADVTTNDADDLEYLSKLWAKRKEQGIEDDCHALGNLGTYHQLSILCQGDDPTSFYYVYLLLLTKLRANSYNALFMASAKNESYETLAGRLDSMNKEMFELAESMAEADRPRFYNDPQFKFIPDDASIARRESILAVQLTYFLHLMVINRLWFVTSSEDECTGKNLEFRNISLNAARTILVLVKQINRTNTITTYFNWVLFFPVSAFLTISASLLSNPEAPEAFNDLQLLNDSSQNFFGSDNNWVIFEKARGPELHPEKDAVLLLLTKLLLRICLRYFERRMGVALTDGNSALEKHLEDAKIRYPEVFKPYTKNINEPIVFGASPFGDSKHSYGRTSNSSSASRTPINQSPGLLPSLNNILHPRNDTTGSSSNPSSLRGGQSPSAMASGPVSASPGWAYPNLSQNLNVPVQHQPYLPQTAVPPLQSPRSSAQFVGIPQEGQGNTRYYSSRRGTASTGSIPGIPEIDANIVNGQGTGTEADQAAGGIVPGMQNNELYADYLNDDALTSMFFSQMNSLPNFFFDNSLGVEQ